jgi:uncharacterized SAM-binding protein YcdF (DUF218 family)
MVREIPFDLPNWVKNRLFVPEKFLWHENDRADACVSVPFGMAKHGGMSCQSYAVADQVRYLIRKRMVNAVVFCGGHRKYDSTLTEARAAKEHALGFKLLPELAVGIEEFSRDTHENARFCWPWLRSIRCQSAILCVNALQSGRALRVFQKELPEISFRVAPVLGTIWHDNLKITLRDPYVFALRELSVWALFQQRGWL